MTLRRPKIMSRLGSPPANRTPRLHLVALESRLAPSGVPTSWTERGAGGGGALYAPQYNPANPADIYVASDTGQVYHTTTAGASWQEVDFRQLQGGQQSRVQFTEDANVRYTIDYSAVGGVDKTRPSKTLDGGTTWAPTSGDPTAGEAVYLFADPANHNRVIVSDYTHMYLSIDGGTTWALRRTASDVDAGLLIGGVFWDGSTIYVGTNDGVLVSTNNGTSFAVQNIGGLANTQVIVSFVGAKSGTTTRFLAVTNDSSVTSAGMPGYLNDGSSAVYTWQVGSSSWTLRGLGPTAWPFFAGMSPANINTMYVAGSSAAGVPTLYKSTNGGVNWISVLQTDQLQNVATGWAGYNGDRGWDYGGFALGLAVSPTDPNNAVFTDLGFAYSTSNGGNTWRALYVAAADQNAVNAPTPTGRAYHDTGLDNTSAWGVTWADPTHLFISDDDLNGQLSTDGGQSFGFGYTGLSLNAVSRVIKHPASGTLYAATGSALGLYQFSTLGDADIDGETGRVMYSTNQGAAWQLLHDFGHAVAWVAADPTNANRLYASVANSGSTVGGVWVTNNLSAGAGSTWTRLASPPRTQGHVFNVVVLNDGTLVASYSGRDDGTGTNTLTASSGVFVSTNGGQTWADRSNPAMQYWTKDVVVDPFDPTQNTWYAGVYSGALDTLGGLYKTTNRGQSWARVSSGLTSVESITFNPADSNEAFVTTESQGLWYSNNVRAATPTFTQVASYTFRQPERVFFNPYNANEIWVTSVGGGVRTGTTPSTVVAVKINDGSAQRSEVRSLTVTFSGQVAFTGGDTNAAAAFALTRVTGAGGTVGLVSSVSLLATGQTAVTLTFTGATATDAMSAQNGGLLSLDDGRFQLTIGSASVTAASGGLGLDGDGNGTAGGNYVSPTDTAAGGAGQLRLFRLFGDADGNGTVDLVDLSQFRSAFNLSSGNSGFLDYLDSDHNGLIDLVDLGQFRSRFNVGVF